MKQFEEKCKRFPNFKVFIQLAESGRIQFLNDLRTKINQRKNKEKEQEIQIRVNAPKCSEREAKEQYANDEL